MLDALFIGFDMAVKHGGIRMETDLMRRARNGEPLLAADFVVTNYLADAGIEDFRAATGERIHGGVFEREQGIADGKLGDTREIANFDHGEGLQVHAGTARLQAANQVEKIFKREIGVKAAHQPKFPAPFPQTLFGPLPNLPKPKLVAPRAFRPTPQAP